VVRTDTHVLLSDSVELDDLERARIEAACRVGELLKVHASAIWSDKEWHMDVTDNAGLILFAIQISAMKTSATKSFRHRLSRGPLRMQPPGSKPGTLSG
jgi:hypothetical protein